MRFENMKDDEMAAGLSGWLDEAREALDALAGIGADELGRIRADVVKATASHMVDVVRTTRPMKARNDINLNRHNIRGIAERGMGALVEAASLDALLYWLNTHDHVDGVDDADLTTWREWTKNALQEAIGLMMEQQYEDDEKRAYNEILKLCRRRGVKPQRADGWTAWDKEYIDKAVACGWMRRDGDKLIWLFNERTDGRPHKASLAMFLRKVYHAQNKEIPYKRWQEALGYSVKRAVEEVEEPNRRRQRWEDELI